MPQTDELYRRLTGEQLTTRRISVTPKTYDKDKRSVRVVAATDTPVEVFDWERWEIIREILLAKGFELRSGDQAPLLDTHSRWSVGDVLGSARNWEAKDSQVEADIMFSSDEDAVRAEGKVREGHVTDVSVGYKPLSSIYVPKGQRQVIEGKEYEGPVRVTTKWRVHELSLVPIGADALAKARSANQPAPSIEEIAQKVKAELERQEQATTPTPKGRSTPAMAEPSQKTPEEILKDERERYDAIEAIAAKFVGRIDKIEDLKREALKNGNSVAEFKGMIADRVADSKPLLLPDSHLDLSNKDRQRFSFVRAILGQLPDSGIKDGFERECSVAIAKRLGIEHEQGRYIPYDVLMRGSFTDYSEHPDYQQFFRKPGQRLMQRDQTVGSATGGGNLVGTELLGGSFIELLRSYNPLTELGVRFLTGLSGNIAFPRQTGASTVAWGAEGAAVAESSLTFGQVALAPNEVSAFVEYTYRLLLQSTPGIEGIIQADLAREVALGIATAFFHGAGGDAPTGLIGISGVGSVTAAGIGWDEAVEFETDVASANADVASMAYVMNAIARGILKTRLKVANFPQYLMENNEMNGYRSVMTNIISNGYVFFGDYSHGIVGEWGVLRLLANPFSRDTEGIIRVTARHAVDSNVRQPGAFTFCSDLS